MSTIALQEEQKRKKKEDGDEKGAKFVGRVKGKKPKKTNSLTFFSGLDVTEANIRVWLYEKWVGYTLFKSFKLNQAVE